MTLSDIPALVLESPFTFALMAVVSIVSLLAFTRKKIFANLLLHPYSVFKYKQYYRVVTSDFVHVDLWHFGFNQLTLYTFCSNLEEVLNHKFHRGNYLLLIIYFCSMLMGNIIVALINRKDFEYSSAGCSGSVTGCLFGFMIIDPHGSALNEPLIGSIENIYSGLLFIIALIFYKLKRKNEVINFDLHFYGAVGGILATLVMITFSR
jgi:membrane associated rhomboid family serine protease